LSVQCSLVRFQSKSSQLQLKPVRHHPRHCSTSASEHCELSSGPVFIWGTARWVRKKEMSNGFKAKLAPIRKP
jgi:hypothetical protein